MFVYIVIEAILGIAALIVLAVCSKKTDGVVYNKLDKVGWITNIVLISVYVCLSPLYLFLGVISYPAHNGFLGIIGWIVSIINASTTLFCGVGIGFSIALRKKGKSKLSFVIQFVGLVSIALTIGMYCLFAGNLLLPLN